MLNMEIWNIFCFFDFVKKQKNKI